MNKQQADETALRLTEIIINAHHAYMLPQSDNYEQIADDVVSLIEAISERLQRSKLS
ncbi:hypothetical protein P9057_06660 [Gallibacterium anatis]|uniref:Uncharacterized protein n=1 Tax=Gallibacterium anatis TaxID=750 RepID=A0A377H7S3_9PAST|nr:hypothetical protein [Gallibacterium anatis]STO38167.1 Uncharacterised protein [Gallibacterium anatis]